MIELIKFGYLLIIGRENEGSIENYNEVLNLRDQNYEVRQDKDGSRGMMGLKLDCNGFGNMVIDKEEVVSVDKILMKFSDERKGVRF